MTGFVVIGTERTGTTLLISLINSHPQIKVFGELFGVYSEGNYLSEIPMNDPLPEWLTVSPIPFYNTYIQNGGSTDSYLDNIFNDSWGYEIVGVKLIKSQLRNDISSSLKNRNLKYIHNIRRNTLATIVANVRTGVFKQSESVIKEKADYLKNQKVTLHTDDLCNIIKNIENANSEYAQMIISWGANYLPVFYEDIISIKDEISKDILNFLNVDSSILLSTPSYKVSPSRLRDSINNYEEVKDYLLKNGLERYLY